jgi:hypothetical protein
MHCLSEGREKSIEHRGSDRALKAFLSKLNAILGAERFTQLNEGLELPLAHADLIVLG